MAKNKIEEEKKEPSSKKSARKGNSYSVPKFQPKKTPNLSKFADDTWRSMKIFTIISESKLLNSNDFEILMQGELFKYTHPQGKIKSAQLYSSKFSVITKSDLIIHRSKESFLRLQNPVQIIPLIDITSSNKIKISLGNLKGKDKNYVNFFIEMKEEKTAELHLQIDSRNSKFNSSLSKVASQSDNSNLFSHNSFFLESTDINKLGSMEIANLNDSVDIKKPMKMSLLGDKSVGQRIESIANKDFKEDLSLLTNPKIIILAGINEDIVNRWLCVINYFIS
jgi:hypothetical protein